MFIFDDILLYQSLDVQVTIDGVWLLLIMLREGNCLFTMAAQAALLLSSNSQLSSNDWIFQNVDSKECQALLIIISPQTLTSSAGTC